MTKPIQFNNFLPTLTIPSISPKSAFALFSLTVLGAATYRYFCGQCKPRTITCGFQPTTEPQPDYSRSHSKYVEDCCLEVGLIEPYLCNLYVFGKSEPITQITKTKLKPNTTITRLQVASLCILKYAIEKTKDTALIPDFLFGHAIDESTLQTLSLELSRLTDQELIDLRNSFTSLNECPASLLKIAQNIQAQVKILREDSQFLRAFFDLPLPRKPPNSIETPDTITTYLHIPNITDYPE